MSTLNHHVLHARALRADLLASPTVWVPRREVLLDWLAELLARAQDPHYVFDATAMKDLDAVDRFLRDNKVPTAPAT
ncbi:hypothetical protein [Opitutus terrae]|uniref:Uncharacterized protein n=1 Tax=Opitutus terrae (strain DSM 11246 / JCM 15787 / PB90-1) TaxID=452637 RepID=B1ZW76_OPITP|nr:hypothetical protein [Opitutus terrae]ACB76828.1 hypothetical protein Oter_3551 [Opitutus terrae PB90-1]